MADASCGPSNPLQQFRKAAQADRTLQQDKLVNRSSPNQAFRSAPGPAAGNLDPEFEAFQAGLPSGPGLPDPSLFHPPPFHTGPVQQQPQLPAWAADFQRLHISSPQPQAPFAPRVHSQPAPSSWHQDFLRQQQQQPRAPAPQQTLHQTPVHSMFGGVPRYGMLNQNRFEPSFAERPAMTVAQGKQRMEDGGQKFDDGAFDQAFEQIHQEMAMNEAQSQEASAQESQALQDTQERLRLLEQENKLRLLNMRKEGQTLAAQEQASRIAAEIEQEQQEQAQQFDQIDAEELRQSRRNLLNMYEPVHDDPLADQHDILDQIEAEAQARFQEELQTLPEQKQDMQPPEYSTDADELSRTAGQLLDSVEHDQSEKFQQSNFLELMRRLRDKEVRVEGNKMVENDSTTKISQRSHLEHALHNSGALQESIPREEQDTDLGRMRQLEDFDFDTFLSSPPETRHEWQQDLEESMMRGAIKSDEQSAAMNSGTSYADDVDVRDIEATKLQFLSIWSELSHQDELTSQRILRGWTKAIMDNMNTKYPFSSSEIWVDRPPWWPQHVPHEEVADLKKDEMSELAWGILVWAAGSSRTGLIEASSLPRQSVEIPGEDNMNSAERSDQELRRIMNVIYALAHRMEAARKRPAQAEDQIEAEGQARAMEQDDDTSGEESIEARVARIKRRVAELTGDAVPS